MNPLTLQSQILSTSLANYCYKADQVNNFVQKTSFLMVDRISALLVKLVPCQVASS